MILLLFLFHFHKSEIMLLSVPYTNGQSSGSTKTTTKAKQIRLRLSKFNLKYVAIMEKLFERICCLRYQKLIVLLAVLSTTSSYALENNKSNLSDRKIELFQQPGFFRFSYDNLKMPQHNPNMGLL